MAQHSLCHRNSTFTEHLIICMSQHAFSLNHAMKAYVSILGSYMFRHVPVIHLPNPGYGGESEHAGHASRKDWSDHLTGADICAIVPECVF